MMMTPSVAIIPGHYDNNNQGVNTTATTTTTTTPSTTKPPPEFQNTPLCKQWPSQLMQLMNESSHDDEWGAVRQRIQTHPHEILIAGQNGGQNALHAACVRYPPLPIVAAMLTACPTAAVVQNFAGETPLHLASYSASEEVQALLAVAQPTAAGLGDRYGDRPLHFAAREGATYPLMETLLRAAPAAIQAVNKRGVTPFWLLPRSFLEAEQLQDIVAVVNHVANVANANHVAENSDNDEDDDDSNQDTDMYEAGDDDDDDEEDETSYADDWNLMVLFLRYAYFDAVAPTSPRADTFTDTPNYDWLVAAAAATPACPREVLRFLCRMFPQQACLYDKDGYTPLIRACLVQDLAEPSDWDENEDGFREPVEATDGILQNETDYVAPEDRQMVLGDIEFVQQQVRAVEDTDTAAAVEEPSVIEILLEWSPRSAFLPDVKQQRLPLAHALASGKSWNSTIRHLIAASPRALERMDPPSQMHMFQLAAMHAPELDTVYTIVRSLPVLVTSSVRREVATNYIGDDDAMVDVISPSNCTPR